jgi:simple sugar transport system ATP-binding protein
VCEHREAIAGGDERLGVEGLSYTPDDPFGTSLSDVTLAIRAGEILGLAGISGNGQKELLAVLSGEQPLGRAQSHCIRLDGREVGHLGAAPRRDLGLVFVPEERLGRGAVPTMSLTDNALLTAHRSGLVRAGFIDASRARRFTARCVADYDVKCGGVHVAARSLSGGNLQKFIVGRELEQKPKALIAAQPTWGLDVGAAAAIRQALLDLRDDGVAILVVSEELEELFEICDRIVVIAEGRLSPAKLASDTDMEEIGLWMSGMFPTSGRSADEISDVA